MHHAKVLYAGVGLYCSGYGHTLVRNQGYQIDFLGFEEIGLISMDSQELLAFDQYKRIKWNLDETNKPKRGVIKKVHRWIQENDESIIIQKLANNEIVNISDLNIHLDYNIIIDLMTIYPKQIFEIC